MTKQESTKTLELENDRAAVVERMAEAEYEAQDDPLAWSSATPETKAWIRRKSSAALTALGWPEEHRPT